MSAPTPAVRRSSERGVALVLFALFAFLAMGVGALVLDLGQARLAHLQMQNAVDAAALKGARLRDVASEAERRAAVRTFVGDFFSDARGEPAHALGDLRLGAGVGDANALQPVIGPDVYKPALQTNLEDEPHGDMVAGAFLPDDTAHAESASYERTDFVPGEAGLAFGEVRLPAFLVRMRRTPDLQGLDDEAGTSSRGPPLPFLFGRASLMAGGDPAAGYSPRHHGITVRATAIADARDGDFPRTRVRSVGEPLALPDGRLVRGATPFMLARALWVGLSPGVTQVLPVGGDGTFVASSGTGRFTTARAVSIGAPVPPAEPPDADGPVVTGYAPVFQTVGGAPRVIGFGYVTASWTVAPAELRLTRLRRIVAPENASAVLAPLLETLAPADRAALLLAHSDFPGSLLAPVLVR